MEIEEKKQFAFKFKVNETIYHFTVIGADSQKIARGLLKKDLMVIIDQLAE